MMRRRLYKRSHKFHEIQESFRENARLSSEDSRNEDFAEDEESLINNASNPQYSPESVLFESDPCLCSGELSPEIVLGRRKARSPRDPKIHEDDDAIVARRIERSSLSRECHESSDLLMCNFNIESRDDLANLEKCPKLSLDDPLDLTDGYSCSLASLNNDVNETHDEQSSELEGAFEETTRQSISQSVTSPVNLESQSRDDSVLANPCEKRERSTKRRSLEEDSNQRENRDVPGTMGNCNSLDRTFSMNDDLLREMNNYLEGQSSTMIAHRSTVEATEGKLQKEYLSESGRFAIFHEIEKRSSRFSNDVGSIEDRHAGSRIDKETRRRTPNDNRRFDIVLGKIGERLTANWSEFRKMFAYLQRASRKICGEDAECRTSLLYRMFPYVSLSTSSSSSSSSSPPKRNRRESSTDRGDVAARFSFIPDEGREFSKGEIRSEQEAQGIESKIRKPETFPCSPERDFRNATLTYDCEGEVKKQRQAKIADPLPEKGVERSLDLPSRDKMHWDHDDVSWESTLDLSTVSDHDNSLQKVTFHYLVYL
ncbi:hypothetical protein RF55_5714 [Lasius niger]|uniref:Uncharacterized protein n=1 Tax=Lasius niger TaxID=67767 RepID=A0A0J7KV69_LASNI|nr:hypothetical protein RF55_5714 [Lasius niger]